MLTCQRINLWSLPPENQALYSPLIADLNPSLLFDPSSAASWVAYEARWDQKVIALAILELFSNNRVAQLQSIYVTESFRQQGIGLALFRTLQADLVSQGCLSIGFEYRADLPAALALEKIVAHLRWLPPKVYMIRCYYDEAARFNPPWYQRHLSDPFPPSLNLFLWQELSRQEKERIRFRAEQGEFHPYLSPFREEKNIEHLNSLGLRCGDRIVGWNITHRLDPETIKYSTLYIEKEFHLQGYAILLLIHSLRLQHQSLIPKAVFEINLEEIDRPWWFFVKKRLMPYADRIEKRKWAVQTFV